VTFNHFDASEDGMELESFDGTTRLFPLPNVVLFPGALLPLHIFEPRYRQMTSDALEGDRLITMVLLKPGHESEYDGSPPIFDTGCIGRIIYHEMLPDGRSNLILKGLRRVRIQSEFPTSAMYRTVSAVILHDLTTDLAGESISSSVKQVLATMREILRVAGRDADANKLLAAEELPPGRLTDLACHCLAFDVEAKQSMLSELNVSRRIETVLAWMEALLHAIRRRHDPSGPAPPFSRN
jgi:Lon protease-like protein